MMNVNGKHVLKKYDSQRDVVYQDPHKAEGEYAVSGIQEIVCALGHRV